MPRSRSRERERRNRSRDRRSRSKSRERRKSRDRSDYKRKDKSAEKYSSSKRDKYDAYKRKSRDRSYEKSSHRNKSPERDRKKRRESRDRRRSSSRSKQRSNSSDNNKKTSNSSKSQSGSVKPIVIIANHNKKKQRNHDNEASNNAQDHRASFEISNEFSQEGFEQFGRDHGIDFTNIETEEDREVVHEKMEELLKAHFAAQGKVYPPPKVEKPVVNNVTGFANDGSFLEQFKKMQEEYKQQQETDEKKKQTIVNNLKNLPINKRRGGKILKTGLVSKTIVTPEGTITTNAYDSYYKEVQKYKNSSSCDSSDSKTRPLVK